MGEQKSIKILKWHFAESEIKTIRQKYNIKFKRFESHPNHYLCPDSGITYKSERVCEMYMFDMGLRVS